LRFFRPNHDSQITTHALALLVAAALAACGVETATTAATGAVIKKQEVEQGKKTLEQSREKIEQAMQQTQQRAEQDREAGDK
jgi:hypothetical protein